jgi:hypothetical protein
MALSKVLFPAPLGPMSVTISRRSTSIETPWTTGRPRT